MRTRIGIIGVGPAGLLLGHLPRAAGIDARLDAEGVPHDGFALADSGRLIRIDIAALIDPRVTVYG